MSLGDPANLVKPRGIQGPHDTEADPEHYDGELQNSANDEDDKLYVIIPEISHHHRHGPARWHPRVNKKGKLYFPKKGDACVVRLSPAHGGQVWITAWWKAKSFNADGDDRPPDADPVGDASDVIIGIIESSSGPGAAEPGEEIHVMGS
jgi:hypothetical protein